MSKVLFGAILLAAATMLTACNDQEPQVEAEAPVPAEQDVNDASGASQSSDRDVAEPDAAAQEEDAAARDQADPSQCPTCVTYKVALEGQPNRFDLYSCEPSLPEGPALDWFEQNCSEMSGTSQFLEAFAVEVVVPAP